MFFPRIVLRWLLNNIIQIKSSGRPIRLNFFLYVGVFYSSRTNKILFRVSGDSQKYKIFHTHRRRGVSSGFINGRDGNFMSTFKNLWSSGVRFSYRNKCSAVHFWTRCPQLDVDSWESYERELNLKKSLKYSPPRFLTIRRCPPWSQITSAVLPFHVNVWKNYFWNQICCISYNGVG